MIEKSIYLEGIDPIVIYGINNTNLDRLKSYFPKIRIVARGHEIKVIGDNDEIVNFEEKLFNIIDLAQEKNSLNDDDIELSDINSILDTSYGTTSPGGISISDADKNYSITLWHSNGKNATITPDEITIIN